MRVGVELMMTNISVAKSSLLPSKMMQGTWSVFASLGALLHVEVQRRQAVLAVDDEVLALRLLEVADVGEAASPARSASRSAVKRSTVPGMGGWLIAVS